MTTILHLCILELLLQGCASLSRFLDKVSEFHRRARDSRRCHRLANFLKAIIITSRFSTGNAKSEARSVKMASYCFFFNFSQWSEQQELSGAEEGGAVCMPRGTRKWKFRGSCYMQEILPGIHNMQ